METGRHGDRMRAEIWISAVFLVFCVFLENPAPISEAKVTLKLKPMFFSIGSHHQMLASNTP